MMIGAFRTSLNIQIGKKTYKRSIRFMSCMPRCSDSIYPSTSSHLHHLHHHDGDNHTCSGITNIRSSTITYGFQRNGFVRSLSTSESDSDSKYIKLADPAPGSPFHLALPVHDLDIAKDFYGNIIGCAEGRSSAKWQDYSLNGHQIVCHWVGNDYRCQDYFNPVDGYEVPVPHFGLALTKEQFHSLAERIRAAGIQFIIEPHLRFQGQPGEQLTMFFKDPSGNNLEFKTMTKIDNLFAKYNVADE